MEVEKPDRKKRKVQGSKATNGDGVSVYSTNQFAALRTLKKVRRPAGSELLSTGPPRLEPTPSTGSTISELSSLPSDRDEIRETSAPTTILSGGSGQRGRKRQVEERKWETHFPDMNAVSSFQPSVGNVVSNNSNLCVVALKPEETICFQGMVLATPISGCLSVFGHRLVASTAWKDIATSKTKANRSSLPPLAFYPCFSPKSQSLLVLKADALPDSNTSSTPVKDLPAIQLADRTISQAILDLVIQLKTRADPSVTIIALQSMTYSNLQGIEGCMPLLKGLLKDEVNGNFSIGIPGFYPIFNPIPNVTALSIPHQWSDVATSIASYVDPGQRKVICIVGSKNMGKSTLARYLINRLLNCYQEVAFLECDIGQPEFTSTGLASLNVVTAPLLGPPFTHLQPPRRSFYLGATSAKHDPDYYLECLHELYNEYENTIAGTNSGNMVPLVINTHGWIKGMGVDLLVHFLARVRPTNILQMSVPNNTPQSSSKNLNVDLADVLSNMIGNQTNVCVTQVPAIDDSAARAKFGASDHRALGLLSYFYQTLGHPAALALSETKQPHWWSFHEAITARVPYQVPFKSLKIRFMHGEVPFSQTFHALNGCVVALVIDQTAYETPQNVSSTVEISDEDVYHEAAKSLRIVPSQIPLIPASHNCVGLGLVRSIDIETGVFYIVTGPIPPKQLAEVNMLVRGAAMEIPVNLVTAGYENSRAHLPYTTHLASEGIGSLAWRTRHNLLRRRRPPGGGTPVS
ncbi:polynucleotide 5'-hydroxyl-kinase [Spizellomyces punctatus DAOM BR117]|uniref:Polynucleotide 5'-hydroxyl-kinase GRC3 n=1 Tax=Spizellomyces punctatus (strain DAOM BR117) TaxID=645134 RepID=A0A0L0HJW9_SPIPD|nr:polynucleotide 5'-hydroxyl-kinase [Spizellomyces punctatus DAOM BR117]KND01333.1 hypothetical protein SPPG_03145 [Spizellomyces punctatus DAOM BR117]|eukprot:XP_016609372.1 hypothetical protein SPPG_03145 [Spizellomyces punctatus DAOM BR117]